ncbi:SPOSA6832_01794, partial [Sporobolomyces salmonicolor]
MSSREAVAAAQPRTLARLAQVKHHFDSAKGSQRFGGKVAILTGVGSEKGIGRATATLLAREGAKHLYVLDFAADSLPALKSSLESAYPDVKVTHFSGDAADTALIQSICEHAMQEEGRLDFFFANAGTTGGNLNLEGLDEEGVMEVMRVNVLSCFVAVKHASAAMKRNPASSAGGSILLTASVAGLRSGAGPQDYSASKAGVINLANTSAQILGGTGIRCNALCPGLIETGMTTYTFDRARERGTLGKVGQLNPLRRFGIAEEIAQAALWLASDDSSYVNGIALPVDGGLSSSLPTAPGHFM